MRSRALHRLEEVRVDAQVTILADTARDATVFPPLLLCRICDL